MKTTVLLAFVFATSIGHAAWYWPFGKDEDAPDAPPRLHRLLETANDLIENAEEEAADGNAEKAIDLYGQALDELSRIQAENPDRAETPEFAPLRNKAAACQAAIDSIRFEQVDANVRSVAMTDTEELQRKWNRKHGIKEPAARPAPDRASSPTAPAAPPPDGWNGRLLDAAAMLRSGDWHGAEAALGKMDEERPGDLDVMIMQAAAVSGTGRLYAAKKILERAAKAHPESFLPLYNMAYVALELGEGRREARRLYEEGRALGGPENKDLESKTKDR